MPNQHLYLEPDLMAARAGSVPSLDGLRALSIGLVLLAHFVSNQIPGGLGVYVFFVVSGFLITRLLFAEYKTIGQISLPQFYARRILRLYPVILVFTALVMGLSLFTGRPTNWIEPVSALGYFANYWYAHLEAQNIPPQLPFAMFWSLSIEEHFYILFPVCFVWLRDQPARLLQILLGLILTCLCLRLLGAWLQPEAIGSMQFYSETHYRLDSIGFGVVLAIACETEGGRRLIQAIAHPAWATTALVVIFGCLLIRDPWFRETFRYTLLGIAITAIIAAILFGQHYGFVQTLLNSAALAWVGRLSYSLYVWHGGVAFFIPSQNLSAWQHASLCLITSLAIATLSYYVVEQPCLHLKKYLRNRPAPTPQLALVKEIVP